MLDMNLEPFHIVNLVDYNACTQLFRHKLQETDVKGKAKFEFRQQIHSRCEILLIHRFIMYIYGIIAFFCSFLH